MILETTGKSKKGEKILSNFRKEKRGVSLGAVHNLRNDLHTEKNINILQ